MIETKMEEVLEFIENEFKSCEAEARKQGSFEGPWEPTEVDFDWIVDRVNEKFGEDDRTWELLDQGWREYRSK